MGDTSPLTDVKAALGRDFVLVGAAPASFGTALLYWYEHRASGSFWATFSFNGGQNLGGLILLTLVASVLLYLLAPGFTAWLQRVPAFPEALETHARRRAGLAKEEERLVQQGELVNWARKGFPHWPSNTLFKGDLFDHPDPTPPLWQDYLPERLRALEWWAARHDDPTSRFPHCPPATLPEPRPEQLDAMDAYIEHSRDVIARKRSEMTTASRQLRIGRFSAMLDQYGLRYAMPTNIMLSRLLPVIDEKARTAINDARVNVESLVAFVIVLLTTCTVVVSQSLSASTLPNGWDPDAEGAVLCASCAVAALLCWHSAGTFFRRYASLVVSILDTSQELLFTKLGLEKQTDPQAAKALLTQASSFLSEPSEDRWRPEMRPTLQISLPPTLEATGAGHIRVVVTVTRAGTAFIDRELTLRASRGSFLNGEQILRTRLTGFREGDTYTWIGQLVTYYATPSSIDPVEFFASCGEVSTASTLALTSPIPDQIDFWVDSVAPVSAPVGYQVDLRVRLRRSATPTAQFRKDAPEISASGTAYCWRATTPGEDGVVQQIWFVPSPPSHPITFTATFGALPPRSITIPS